MRTFLQLIRFYQLIIIAVCMYALRYFMLEPVLEYFGERLIMPEREFGLLVISVLLITAGAGIINDYFDRKADLHNRPDRVIVGIHINRRMAIILHSFFSVLGIIVGWYVAYKAGFFWFGLIFPFITFIFWRYSSLYKYKMLIGNIIMALLVAGIPFLVFTFEYFFAVKFMGKTIPSDIYHHLMVLSLGFSCAVFLVCLAHEITKNIKDFRGDYQTGAKTLPIRMGKNAARTVISLILVFFVLAMVTGWFVYLTTLDYIQYNTLSMIYVMLFIVLPAAFMALGIYNMQRKHQLGRFCTGLKLLIITGMLFTLVIYLNITVL
ncbi:MAG: UbiA family prenyltransferase [Bacteroidota bacterium]|nr:UbiA family prenyltransferase [Bacteroidota bacterium]